MGKSLLNNIWAHRACVGKETAYFSLNKLKMQPVLWLVADLYYVLCFQILLFLFLKCYLKIIPFFNLASPIAVFEDSLEKANCILKDSSFILLLNFVTVLPQGTRTQLILDFTAFGCFGLKHHCSIGS